MTMENPLKSFLKKFTPPDKPDEENDRRDPIFHEDSKEELDMRGMPDGCDPEVWRRKLREKKTSEASK